MTPAQTAPVQTPPSRFALCRRFTLVEEGGYSCDRQDAGNWWGHTLIGSYAGVTAPALLRCYGPQMDQPLTAAYMRHLPDAAAAAVYQSYWAGMGCDRLPVGVDLMVFDFGWNTGERKAVTCLQSTLGFPVKGDPRTDVDGYCGTATASYAKLADLRSLVHDLFDAQILYYSGLRQFDRYGHGWIARTTRRRDAALLSVPAE